jgi:hypothetical protein
MHFSHAALSRGALSVGCMGMDLRGVPFRLRDVRRRHWVGEPSIICIIEEGVAAHPARGLLCIR